MKTIDFAQQGIRLTYQFNPLTWHFYSFKIQQGMYILTFQHFFLFLKMQGQPKLKISFLTFLLTKMILKNKNGSTKLWPNF